MIQVVREKLEDSLKEGQVWHRKEYLHHDGLVLRQSRTLQLEPDTVGGSKFRISEDNGRTYGEWHPVPREENYAMIGDDEVETVDMGKVWNPVHRHYVSTRFERYFVNGHNEAYRLYWKQSARAFYDHQYIRIWRENEDTPYADDLVRYEEGADFDPNDPRDPEYLEKNNGYCNQPIVLKNGDIAVPVGATVSTGCKIAGLDVKTVFPSSPDVHCCVIVARGRFNKETERYDFTFSNPVILSDLRSSRGIDEPILAELESGRLLLVMRGSNVASKYRPHRIEPGTPSFKWFAFSDEGGKTFTTAEPWHFDDRQVIYSSASISAFIRSRKNGKLYWIGNVTDHTAYDNFPRFPLYIAQVDDQYGYLIKETLTEIDTRREGETEHLELSNFSIFEDRETGIIEVSLCKAGQYEFDYTKANAGEPWRYLIDVGE